MEVIVVMIYKEELADHLWDISFELEREINPEIPGQEGNGQKFLPEVPSEAPSSAKKNGVALRRDLFA
jgi:hypothetical protein